ncbi:hypothetical protein GCM10028803_47840 [Larkinella knui]|uniref:GIY-YIG nuclease family protein n=1 Tax=Larkinella knui TaxID=2025310 RepID=A0A3P1CQX2_9BACT|nr:GIY-YIG nuclease family protein [Larkinella knui]RRB15364.1 GIY-YIG nuclease family protein [Larkinella knui]
MKKPGYLYIAANPSLKYDLLKIGISEYNPEKRLEELSRSTSIPDKFRLVMAYQVEDILKAESRIHLLLHEHRYCAGKEYFQVKEHIAIAVAKRVVSLLDHTPLPEMHIHNDFGFHQFNKKLGVSFHRLFLLTMAYSHTNSIFDKMQGFSPDIVDGFLGVDAVTQLLFVQAQRVRNSMKEFTYFAKDLTVSLNKSEPTKVYNDIRYRRGELCWLFNAPLKEQFISW